MHERILACFIVVYIVYFTLASFLRYDNFYAGRFDLGNMVQAVWSTSNGKFFQTTNPDGPGTISRLGYHADFLLALLAPFYMLWSDPRILLLIQSVTLGLGAVFVYAIALHVLKNKTVSLVFAFSYLISPSVQRSNLYDFHAVVLATTLLLGTFYFMQKRRYALFLLFAFLAGISKEQVWFIVALFGFWIAGRGAYVLYFLRKQSLARQQAFKEILFGAFIFLVSLFLFYFFIWHAIPDVRGKQHFALEYYSSFGASPGAIVQSILLTPGKTLEIVLAPDRIEYLKKLFMPLGFLSFFSPIFLVFALPDLLINTLSRNQNLYQIYYQYTATITPFLYISAIYGVRIVRYVIPRLVLGAISVYLLVMTLYSSYLFGPLPYAKERNTDMFVKPLPNRQEITTFLNSLPKDARVASSNVLGAHLSERDYVYTLPEGIDYADYILFLLSDKSAQPSMQFHRDLADRLRNNPNYILVFHDGDFLVFKRSRLVYKYF